VRVGTHSLLFLGGPRLFRSSGPAVMRIFAPLLAAMDGDKALPGLIGGLTAEDADLARAFLAELDAGGLLADGPDPADRPLHRTGRFVRRFAGISGARSETLVAPEDFGRARLGLTAKAPWRAELAALLRSAGLEPGDAPTAAKPVRSVASLHLRNGRERHDVSLEKPLDGGAAVLAVRSTPLDPGEEVPPQGAASVAALLAHWAVLACAGLPAVESIGAGAHPPAAGERAAAAAGSGGGPAIAPEPIAPALAGLAEMCRFGTGLHPAGTRRIAPTAGGLGSPRAVAVVPGAQGSAFAAFRYDAAGHRFDRFATVDPAQWRRAAPEFGDGPFILFLANLSDLEESYWGEAARLAHHDGGMALEHAGRAASALGWSGTSVPVRDSEAVLGALRLAAKDRRLVVTAALALEAPAGGGSRFAAASAGGDDGLKAMLRRRSVRRFDRAAPSPAVVAEIEAALRRSNHAAAAWRRPDSALRLYRLTATPAGIAAAAEVPLGEGVPAGESANPLGSGIFERLIRQPDLARATLCYVLAQPRPSMSGPRLRQSWTDAGSLLCALWIEADRRGVVGAPFGTIAGDRLPLPVGFVAQPLGLCLGLAENEEDLEPQRR
jgi:hypothetical protein